MEGFEYPDRAYVRRHAPGGYKSYESYRDWLRDEFEFRCVYCLHREQWYGRATTFHIDHQIPVVGAPQLTQEYTNLLYTCATCNTAKNDTRDLPDPCAIAFAKCIRFLENGMVEALNKTGKKLVMELNLNSPNNVGYRSRLVRNLAIIRLHDPELYREFMGYPQILPDLRKKIAPQNTKPESVETCYFAMRERGELDETY